MSTFWNAFSPKRLLCFKAVTTPSLSWSSFLISSMLFFASLRSAPTNALEIKAVKSCVCASERLMFSASISSCISGLALVCASTSRLYSRLSSRSSIAEAALTATPAICSPLLAHSRPATAPPGMSSVRTESVTEPIVKTRSLMSSLLFILARCAFICSTSSGVYFSSSSSINASKRHIGYSPSIILLMIRLMASPMSSKALFISLRRDFASLLSLMWYTSGCSRTILSMILLFSRRMS